MDGQATAERTRAVVTDRAPTTRRRRFWETWFWSSRTAGIAVFPGRHSRVKTCGPAALCPSACPHRHGWQTAGSARLIGATWLQQVSVHEASLQHLSITRRAAMPLRAQSPPPPPPAGRRPTENGCVVCGGCRPAWLQEFGRWLDEAVSGRMRFCEMPAVLVRRRLIGQTRLLGRVAICRSAAFQNPCSQFGSRPVR